MPRDLFGEVTRPSISIGNRKWYTLPLSLFSHSAIVLVMIALPILAPAVMPSVFADDDMTAIIKILPPPPPPPKRQPPDTVEPPANPYAAPTTAPDRIAPEPNRPEPFEVDTPGGIIDGTIDDASKVLAPPPPQPKAAAPTAPVRVSGGVRPPQKLNEVNPVYPPMALAARVQGIVIIEATISEDGRVINARVLRSVPLLDQAAVEAVRQWQYSPTVLNGIPVPVIMTVTVNFSLK